MQVIRADVMGMCFGVRDALAVTHQIRRPEQVTIHGELVHNETVLQRLQSRGFRMLPEQMRRQHFCTAIDGNCGINTPDVLITAHGVSDAERKRLESAGRRLIDTTCPLVRRVHQAARALAADGCHVLVIGRSGHVEVVGIVEDLPSYDVVGDVDEVRRYPSARLGVVCQSTTTPGLAQDVYAAIKEQNPYADIRFVDTICQPTRDRQQAVERLLEKVDAMVVVGGRNSNNTRQLVGRCRERGRPAFHIQSSGDIRREWFCDCRIVGLTAGTSTLDSTIEEVHQALCQLEVGANT